MNPAFTASQSIQKLSSSIDRRFYLILSMVLLGGLLLRVFALLDLKNSIYFDVMLWDERLYHEWAKDIAEGTARYGIVEGVAPLPAYFMGLIYWVFSSEIVLIRYTNIVLGMITCYLMYLIGCRMGSRMVGLVAALIGCLYKPFIFYSIVPLNTALSILLCAATITFLLAVFDSKSILNALLLGIAVGLMINVRPNAAVWMPFLPLAIAMVRFQGKASIRAVGTLLALYVIGLTLSLAPFSIHSYVVAGDARPMPSRGGIHLYLSNQIDYPNGVPFATTLPQEQGTQFTIEASRRADRTMSSNEASAYWTRQVVNSMKKEPWKHTKSLLRKCLLVLNGFEVGDQYDIGFISEFVPFFRLPFIPFWVVLPFGIAGMALTAPRNRKLAALVLTGCVYAATLVIFSANISKRLPLLVLLIPFAVLGIRAFSEEFSNKHRVNCIGYGLVFVFVAIIQFLPLRDTKDMTAFLNTHAVILSSQGNTREAVPFWEESSKLEGRYSAYANLALTDVHMMDRNFYKASEYLDRIQDDSFAAALKHEKLGDFFVLRRKGNEAVRAYRKALEYNQGLRRTRVKLIKILSSVDPVAAQAEYEKLQYINGFYELSEYNGTNGDRRTSQKGRAVPSRVVGSL